jgi:alkanesulfonate monooxygenase SsuD/methylene tetrahydromethanopterin reductase-like flavin-dependent oxidoreductase (luciferase family)
MTLREIAKHQAMHGTFPSLGTPDRVADIIEQTAAEGGADGFHFRTKFGDIGYLIEVATRLMPVQQQRGLARAGYAGTTLRETLFAF